MTVPKQHDYRSEGAKLAAEILAKGKSSLADLETHAAKACPVGLAPHFVHEWRRGFFGVYTASLSRKK